MRNRSERNTNRVWTVVHTEPNPSENRAIRLVINKWNDWMRIAQRYMVTACQNKTERDISKLKSIEVIWEIFFYFSLGSCIWTLLRIATWKRKRELSSSSGVCHRDLLTQQRKEEKKFREKKRVADDVRHENDLFYCTRKIMMIKNAEILKLPRLACSLLTVFVR